MKQLHMLNFYDLHNKKLDKYDQFFDEIHSWNNRIYRHDFPHLPNIVKRIPRDAYRYSCCMNNYSRWIEAEPVIMKNSYYAYRYARDIIKGRWPEAEPHILMNSWHSYEYAKYVIMGRWPEAEPIIMKSTQAPQYARDILKERWLEAEPYMDKKCITYSLYKDAFNLC
jgi:hypothetical protein